MAEYLKEGISRDESLAADAEVRQKVTEILEDIDERGDEAVRELSEHFDDWSPESFRVVAREDRRAYLGTTGSDRRRHRVRPNPDPELRPRPARRFKRYRGGDAAGGVAGAQERAGKQRRVLRAGWPLPDGGLGPHERRYGEGAGVKRVIACTPPRDGEPHAETIAAMAMGGADEIYLLGGVQAMAAMAIGTEAIEPVDMLVGPGNAFVAEAKRQLFGRVGIDLLAGPTEVLVVADETADAEMAATDLLGQAEHGPTSPAVLITTSEELAGKCRRRSNVS